MDIHKTLILAICMFALVAGLSNGSEGSAVKAKTEKSYESYMPEWSKEYMMVNLQSLEKWLCDDALGVDKQQLRDALFAVWQVTLEEEERDGISSALPPQMLAKLLDNPIKIYFWSVPMQDFREKLKFTLVVDFGVDSAEGVQPVLHGLQTTSGVLMKKPDAERKVVRLGQGQLMTMPANKSCAVDIYTYSDNRRIIVSSDRDSIEQLNKCTAGPSNKQIFTFKFSYQAKVKRIYDKFSELIFADEAQQHIWKQFQTVERMTIRYDGKIFQFNTTFKKGELKPLSKKDEGKDYSTMSVYLNKWLVLIGYNLKAKVRNTRDTEFIDIPLDMNKLRLQVAENVKKHEEKYRQHDVYTSLAALNTAYQDKVIPAADNAYELINSSVELLDEIDKTHFNNNPKFNDLPYVQNDQDVPGRGKKYSPQTQKVVETAITLYAPVVKLWSQAKQKKGYWRPLDLTNSFFLGSSQMMSMRNIAIYSVMEAVYEAGRERPHAAYESLDMAFYTSKIAANEPTLIGNLVSIACAGLGCRGLEKTVNLTDLSADDLAALQKNLFVINSAIVTNHKPVMNFEFLCGYDMLCNGLPMPPQKETADVWEKKRQRRDAAYSRLLKLAAKSPYFLFERQYQLELWDMYFTTDESHKTNSKLHDYWKIKCRGAESSIYVYSQMFLGPMMISLSALHKAQMEMKTAETALAVLRYKEKYKKLPNSLDTIVPEFIDKLPVDIFTKNGESLKYRKYEEGNFVVYSVGCDGVDNKGHDCMARHQKYQERSWGGMNEPRGDDQSDIAFTVRPNVKPVHHSVKKKVETGEATDTQNSEEVF